MACCIRAFVAGATAAYSTVFSLLHDTKDLKNITVMVEAAGLGGSLNDTTLIATLFLPTDTVGGRPRRPTAIAVQVEDHS